MTPATVEWTPDSLQVGVHQIEIRVTDLDGLVGVQRYTLLVGDVGEAPVFDPVAPQTAFADVPFILVLSAVDPNGAGVLAYSLVSAPAGGLSVSSFYQ